MFQIYGMAVIFCLQLWRGSQNAKKTKRLDKEEIKNQLIDSLVNNDTSEMEELNEKAGKVEKPEDAATIIKEYEDLIRTKKGIISIPYHQGSVQSLPQKGKFCEVGC